MSWCPDATLVLLSTSLASSWSPALVLGIARWRHYKEEKHCKPGNGGGWPAARRDQLLVGDRVCAALFLNPAVGVFIYPDDTSDTDVGDGDAGEPRKNHRYSLGGIRLLGAGWPDLVTTHAPLRYLASVLTPP
ncbi:hypothetical protein EDB81DRAFT_769275 [Dactylonectria macrodidyma]|uniref:Uncharacterized protein n=1 Tax=Dactylonectria macrodidyma TaxID=307937 RepID=A0A9P9CXW8_9HYPO|nr:hypothetical protein EDB81DRAFT_769275 [Dactylonectria macrodidyma]